MDQQKCYVLGDVLRLVGAEEHDYFNVFLDLEEARKCMIYLLETDRQEVMSSGDQKEIEEYETACEEIGSPDLESILHDRSSQAPHNDVGYCFGQIGLSEHPLVGEIEKGVRYDHVYEVYDYRIGRGSVYFLNLDKAKKHFISCIKQMMQPGEDEFIAAEIFELLEEDDLDTFLNQHCICFFDICNLSKEHVVSSFDPSDYIANYYESKIGVPDCW